MRFWDFAHIQGWAAMVVVCLEAKLSLAKMTTDFEISRLRRGL